MSNDKRYEFDAPEPVPPMTYAEYERDAIQTWPWFELTPENIRLQYNDYLVLHARTERWRQQNPLQAAVVDNLVKFDTLVEKVRKELIESLPFRNFQGESYNFNME